MIKFIAGAVTVVALYLAGWNNIERIGSVLASAATDALVAAQGQVDGMRK